MTTTIFTIGHSRHPADRFLALLRRHGIETLVDVRRKPWSRMNPQFNRERLAAALEAAGLAYLHLEDLGGMRDAPAEGGSPNTGWRNPFLRSYADYAGTPPFGAALAALTERADRSVSAIMCAEGDWRQCHRQIVTDYLLERGFDVRHILPDGGLEPASLTPFATRRDDGTLLYAAAAPPQFRLALD